jgi:hypothetical protein
MELVPDANSADVNRSTSVGDPRKRPPLLAECHCGCVMMLCTTDE